ncbi:MAG: signal peptidase I [Vicinamibacterales bacterium]
MSAKAAAGVEPAPYRKSTAREYFESVVIAVILALFVRTFAFQAFKIPTGSMEQNLLIGDHLLVNKFLFGPAASSLERALLPVRDVQRGDIVVFKYPEEPERDFIKRVIGLPGETLELKGRTIYINGAPLSEPYAQFIEPGQPGAPSEDGADGDVRRKYGPVTVPSGHYFMMGDNRDNSQDSRYWGFLPRDYMKGRAAFIYWSYEAETADYQASGLGDQVGGVFDTVTHFFTKTRWSRLLHQIH